MPSSTAEIIGIRTSGKPFFGKLLDDEKLKELGVKRHKGEVVVTAKIIDAATLLVQPYNNELSQIPLLSRSEPIDVLKKRMEKIPGFEKILPHADAWIAARQVGVVFGGELIRLEPSEGMRACELPLGTERLHIEDDTGMLHIYSKSKITVTNRKGKAEEFQRFDIFVTEQEGEYSFSFESCVPEAQAVIYEHVPLDGGKSSLKAVELITDDELCLEEKAGNVEAVASPESFILKVLFVGS